MGYEDVLVMPEGLLGWRAAGKPVEVDDSVELGDDDLIEEGDT